MKAKKAIKRLSKARILVASIVDQFAGKRSAIGDLLDAASSNINRAKVLIAANGSLPASEQPVMSRRKPMSKEARRRLSIVAKQRWAKAKRAGQRTLAASA